MASEKHLELAAFIKAVHQTLRIQASKLGVDEAWHQHCQQTSVLEKYAEKMQLLATEFWEKNNKGSSELCRIQWVARQSKEYFHTKGNETAATKEEKLSQRYFVDKPFIHIEQSAETTSVLKLLDVGSCYNPFSKFPMFDVTAVDLVPATSDVFKCDFLSVTLSKGTLISNPCVSLPENYFDIVVFSLLLEYFPSSKQRFLCCKKAYELLKPGGLLFILTPDSKQPTANSKVMKSWKYALASIGFWRVTYQKLKHLHCMAYRRCVDSEVPRYWLSIQDCEELPEDLMYIPQDFHDYNVCIDDAPSINRCDLDNKLIVETFSNLPDIDILS